MSRKREAKLIADIIPFPHSRMVGIARCMIDLSETKSDVEMCVIWERQMDVLEVQMIRCGVGLEERAWQLHDLYNLVRSESHRRSYEGRCCEPIEAA